MYTAPDSRVLAFGAGCYRYRLGDWRVVYRVEEDGRIVIILLLIAHRRDAYR